MQVQQQPGQADEAREMTQGVTLGAYNVVATYDSPQEALRAVDELRREGISSGEISIDGAGDLSTQPRVKRSDRRMTGGIIFSVVSGIVGGAIFGAILGGVVTILLDDFNWWMGMIWGMIVFLSIGGILGGQLGIGASSETDRQGKIDRGTRVAVRSTEALPVERGASVLQRLHPRRLYRVDGSGRLLPQA